MSMLLRLLLGGLKSYLPASRAQYTGAVDATSGPYCYSVWLRHLVRIAEAVPQLRVHQVVELGPGDSLGLGCAALLGGAEHYVGLDVVAHARPEHDLQVLDQLVPLFAARADIPDEAAFPELYPRLASYEFPHRLYCDDGPLTSRTDRDRVAAIRASLLARGADTQGDNPLRYAAPWSGSSVEDGSADLVMSQAVLQDVEESERRQELSALVRTMARWTRPGGVMSHQINFAFSGGDAWNHHWRYPDAAWRAVRGNRPFFENRLPLSAYLRLFAEQGFEVVAVNAARAEGLPREAVSARFRGLPEGDFTTPGAHIVAVKR